MQTAIQEKKTPLDQDQRDLASKELDQNLVVMAGAGTGKTTLLIQRLLRLLLGKEISVDRIVALTFTKKAAEEMRERLEDSLRAVIQEPGAFEEFVRDFSLSEETLVERAQTILDEIPKAAIGTIHSFAGSLLRLYPIQAGVDPKFKEDQGEMQSLLFEKEWTQWIKDELQENSTHAENWKTLLLNVSIDDVKELAMALVSPMVDLNQIETPYDLTPKIKEWKKDFQTLVLNHASAPKALKFNESLEALERILDACLNGKEPSDEDREVLARKNLDAPPTVWKDVAADLKRFRRIGTLLLARNDERVQSVVQLVKPLVQRVRRELNRLGSVSFDGLLVHCRNLLRDHKDVRRQLKSQYDTFLVDEFQDTDPLQGEILFYLAESFGKEADHWQKVHLEPGRLFVVGDPKQSIYRFRGADMAAFESFQDEMMKQGAVKATLTTNFRSDPSLLQPVNKLFPPIMKAEKYVQPAYESLQSVRDEKEKGVEIWELDKPNEGKSTSEVSKRLEADAIAEWIQKNMGDDLRYRDCALLFRSANHFGPYLDAFRRRGIPYLAEGEKFFYQTVEVTEFLNLLSAIADPDDELSFVGVLRSSFGALTDKEIYQLKQKGRLTFRKAPSLFKKKLAPLYSTLRNLSELSESVSVASFIQTIFQTTWVLELASQTRYGEQTLANLYKIQMLADRWSENQSMTLTEFIQRFKRYREDEKEEGENPLADARYDAVKLMTIHKAKGLEFPVVFLPNLESPRSGGPNASLIMRDWKTNLVGIRLPWEGSVNSAMVALEQESSRRDEAEEVRVFYVASTRAKSKMVFFLRQDKKTKSGFARYLKDGGIWPVADPKLEQSSIPWKDVSLMGNGISSTEKLSAEWKSASLVQHQLIVKNEEADLKKSIFIQSPSRAMAMTTHKEYEKRWIPDEDREEIRSNAEKVGRLCHRVLEKWSFKQPSSLDVALKEAALFLGYPSQDQTTISSVEEAKAIMESFVKTKTYKELAKQTILGREVPFLYPTPQQKEADPVMMRGVIDLIYEQDKRIMIVDYKTNQIKKDMTSHIEHYRPQAAIYKWAIEKALNKKAHFELVFLRNGQVISID